MDKKVRKSTYREFLRIEGDGWSSGFPTVNLLLKHLSRKTKSVGSRATYCFLLQYLCRALDATPDEFVMRARENPDATAKAIQDVGDKYDNLRSIRYANGFINFARTFLKVNKVELDLHGYFQPGRSRKRPEYIPTLKEALRMAQVAENLRDRLIIMLLTYAGLRNSTLRAIAFSENYPDLLLQDFTIKKEFEKRSTCLVIIVHEIMKLRVANACKNRIFYFTFVPPAVTECFYLYLTEMERRAGPLSDDYLVFPTMNRIIPLRQRLRTPISARELELIVKKAALKAGIKNWQYVYPHCLRKTHESFLRNQPDDVRLEWKEREFLSGHTLPGSQDTYFDKTKIEEMREKYSRMIFEPVSGIKNEERLINEDELQSYLQNGWHYEATLPSQKIVVSRETKMNQSQDTGIKDATEKSEMQTREKTSNEGRTLDPSAPNNNSQTTSDKSKTTITNTQEADQDILERGKSELLGYHEDSNSSLDKEDAKKQSGPVGSFRQSSLSDFGEKAKEFSEK